MSFEPSYWQWQVGNWLISGDGNAAVNAGPGCGKTRTNSWLMELTRHHSLPPASRGVLASAFNKRQVEEMLEKCPRHAEIRTLHAFGLANLRRELKEFTVNDSKEFMHARKLLSVGEFKPKARPKSKSTKSKEDAKAEAKLDAEDSGTLGTALKMAKKLGVLPTDDMGRFVEFCLLNEYETRRLPAPKMAELVQAGLVATLDDKATISFDDMTWMPFALKLAIRHYSWVFIDESQDMNEVMLWLATEAAAAGRCVVVGDPDQAIYAWNGAAVGGFERTAERLNAKVFPLRETFRCPRSVVRFLNGLGYDLTAHASAPEGVLDHVGRKHFQPKPGDYVISRTNAPLMGICLRLIRDGVPAYVNGRDVGEGLVRFIDKMDAQNLDELLAKIEEYRGIEHLKLAKVPNSDATAQAIDDRCDTVIALADGVTTIQDVIQRIGTVIKDAVSGEAVCCSSTHKIKGSEAPRIWVLEGTYMRYRGTDPVRIREERNLMYVAASRTKWIEGDPDSGICHMVI